MTPSAKACMSHLILLIALCVVDPAVGVPTENNANLAGGGVVSGTATLQTRHIMKFPGRNIFRFSDRAFFPPLEIPRTATQPATYLEYFQMMRAAHNGDVFFRMEDGGGPRLVAISGRIADL